jgi:hypothetical protein
MSKGIFAQLRTPTAKNPHPVLMTLQVSVISSQQLRDYALSSLLLRRGPLRSPNLAHLDSGTSPHSTSFCLSTKGGGNFGRIVPVLPLAATTSGISPRSGPDDLLLAFSLIRSSSALHPGS